MAENNTPPKVAELAQESEQLLSGAPDKRKTERMVIDGDVARCRNCKSQLGDVLFGNLYVGRLWLVATTTVRCGVCRERNIWLPQR